MRPGRKQPLYYRRGDITVLGHYESPCGGCDTIGSAKSVYNTTMIILKDYQIVLQEGLLLSEDVKWSSRLPDLKVVFLATPLEQCLANIRKRRQEAGNDKPLNEANTANRVRTIERARLKLIEAGVECRRASADQAPAIVMRWISEAAR